MQTAASGWWTSATMEEKVVNAGGEAEWELVYWPVTFRGNFVRVLFEHAGVAYQDTGSFESNMKLMSLPPHEQPLPFVGPPVLRNKKTGFALSQTAAIVAYLGKKLGYDPSDLETSALALKIVLDCLDILGEISLSNGAQMWTRESWASFRGEGKRLDSWLKNLEASAQRFGGGTTSAQKSVPSSEVWMLGTPTASIADLALFALLEQLVRNMPPLKSDVLRAAPLCWSIVERLAAQQNLRSFIQKQTAQLPRRFCAPKIQASIYAMIEADEQQDSKL
mmetsp:Transcript_11074/g.23757  ORF Transcript_11074/g.23757 Transcript_11074/m.23757 type:complete len:278 (-) Transcript_11074:3607-4440(-)